MDVKEQKGSFRDTLNQSCAYSPIRRTPFILVTLRLRGRVGRDGFKVHFGTVLGDAFSTWRQIRPPKQSHNALDNYLDLFRPPPHPPATSKWPIQSTLFKTDTFGTSAECLSQFGRCPSYRESNKGSKGRQGPTLGVHFTELFILQRWPLPGGYSLIKSLTDMCQ